MVEEKYRPGPKDVPDHWNRITHEILASAFKVHTALGPGLLERLYEQAFAYELTKRGLAFKRQHPIRIRYEDIELGDQVLDLVVADLVVVELKAVDKVNDAHFSQLLSYMRSARLPLGLIINFNTPSLKDGIFRRALTKHTPLPEPFASDFTPRDTANTANSAVSLLDPRTEEKL